MKKLAVLLILFTIGLNAQHFDRAYSTNYGVSWVDSLFSTHADSTIATFPDGTLGASDTSKIYDIRRSWEWYSITIYDSGSVIVDTIEIYLGQKLGNRFGTVIDTAWTQARFRDSTWTMITQPLVNGGAVTTYILYDPTLPSFDFLKVEYANANYVAGRKTVLRHRAVKK